MYGKSYWYGKEVEGRLSDIETVFVRGQLPKNYKEYVPVVYVVTYFSYFLETQLKRRQNRNSIFFVWKCPDCHVDEKLIFWCLYDTVDLMSDEFNQKMRTRRRFDRRR